MSRSYDTRPLDGRLEDVTFMAESDETLSGAANRLGITGDALARWLREHGHTDILTTFERREIDLARGHAERRHLRVARPGETPPAPDPDAEDLVTSQEICTYASISYRQVDYWTRTGILQPHGESTPGSGIPRLYPRHEADVALTIRHLLDAGIDIRIAKTAGRQLFNGEDVRFGLFRLVPIPGDLEVPAP